VTEPSSNCDDNCGQDRTELCTMPSNVMGAQEPHGWASLISSDLLASPPSVEGYMFGPTRSNDKKVQSQGSQLFSRDRFTARHRERDLRDPDLFLGKYPT